jgi:hypothetical protein
VNGGAGVLTSADGTLMQAVFGIGAVDWAFDGTATASSLRRMRCWCESVLRAVTLLVSGLPGIVATPKNLPNLTSHLGAARKRQNVR